MSIIRALVDEFLNVTYLSTMILGDFFDLRLLHLDQFLYIGGESCCLGFVILGSNFFRGPGSVRGLHSMVFFLGA